MEMMQKIARKHGMVCLLHEKPFAGVNGSGKHNNWSISTNTGTNLLEPGETPHENAQFLLFLVAVIKAVDDYQDLLRISVASASNDHRLGAQEAPPAVVSIFLGEELDEILSSIENGTAYDSREEVRMRVGVHTLPKFPRDTTDRNRTSPFAFTGNKFEFRMLGSSESIAETNIMINTAVAQSLKCFADELEGARDFNAALHELIRTTIRDHKRIIFNGNGYDEAWLAEAQRRGLPNFRTAPDAIPHLTDEKNVVLFAEHRVLSQTELTARRTIMLESYAKVIGIEALTMINMVNKQILPAVSAYTGELSRTVKDKLAVCPDANADYEKSAIVKLSALCGKMFASVGQLEKLYAEAEKESDALAAALRARDLLLPVMDTLRAAADEAEEIVPREEWPFPTYGDLLFGVSK